MSQWLTFPRITDAVLEAYERDGYVNLGPVVTSTGLERLRDECMRVWREHGPRFSDSATAITNSMVFDAHRHSDFIRHIYWQGPLVPFAEAAIGPNVKAAAGQLIFKMNDNPATFGWHQDNGYGELSPYNSISCFVALDDAGPWNGGLYAAPGSHKLGQLDVGRTIEDKLNRRTIDMQMEVSERRAVEIRAGDAVCMHCWTLHRSEANMSGKPRRLLFLRYADADSVEVYNGNVPRLGRVLRGTTRFREVAEYERDLTVGPSTHPALATSSAA